MEERKCDFCDKPAKYDAKTVHGPWANVCAEHFAVHAVKTKGTYTTLANIGKPERAPYSDQED